MHSHAVQIHIRSNNETKQNTIVKPCLWLALPAGRASAIFHESRPTLRHADTTAASATKRMRLLHDSSLPGALSTYKKGHV